MIFLEKPHDAIEPVRQSWTRDEYYQMASLGWFAGQRLELIFGEIIVLSPQEPGHATSMDRIRRRLEKALGYGVWVRQVCMPVTK